MIAQPIRKSLPQSPGSLYRRLSRDLSILPNNPPWRSPRSQVTTKRARTLSAKTYKFRERSFGTRYLAQRWIPFASWRLSNVLHWPSGICIEYSLCPYSWPRLQPTWCLPIFSSTRYSQSVWYDNLRNHHDSSSIGNLWNAGSLFPVLK